MKRVRKFTLLNKPFTIEAGEMTPSLKLREMLLKQDIVI